jgi:tetratricopeptide (TPR) repeat protein
MALTDYGKAIELSPSRGSAYHERGRVYVAIGDFDTAMADYTKASELFKSSLAKTQNPFWDTQIASVNRDIGTLRSTIYTAQGKNYEDSNDYKNAIAFYRRAVNANSDNTSAKNSLSAALKKHIEESQIVFPSPFEGAWKCVIKEASTERVSNPPRKVQLRDKSGVPTPYFIDEGEWTYWDRKIPEVSVTYEFTGSNYRAFGMAAYFSASSGIFYYKGNTIELENGVILRFENGRIFDDIKRVYIKQ